MANVVQLSAILPTRNRSAILSRFFASLEKQDTLPVEMVICDGSDDDATKAVCTDWQRRWDPRVSWVYQRANRVGLAPQRNQAVSASTQPFVWFLDDDMLLEPDCVRRLFEAATSDEAIGGVTATLINEPYQPPGKHVRMLMRWFENGIERESYASSCVGPGYTFLHDASLEGPPLMKAEWLGGGCTVYRKAALPTPAVPDHFEGGAIGEDLAASLAVGKHWKLFHVRAARAVHDSQGGAHKRSLSRLADQGLRNRYYIMTQVMGRQSLRDHFDFALMMIFGLASLMTRPSQWQQVPPIVVGYCQAILKLVFRHV